MIIIIFSKKNLLENIRKKLIKKKIQVLSINKKVGINRIRYFGALKAVSEYILFVDDDDNVNGKQLMKIVKLLSRYKTDLVISNYELRLNKKKIKVSPFINFFGKYSPFVKTITPGGGTIFSKKIINNLYKYDFKNFEDWCVGIILIYKQKKKILLNKEIFYYVNYKKKNKKKLFSYIEIQI